MTMVNENGQKRSTEELIISSSCLAISLIVLPFALFRLIEGDYRLALIDLMIFVGLSAIGAVTWCTGNVRTTRWLVSICSMLAVIAVVYSKGAVLVLWLFPVMLLSFFVTKLNHACWINGMGLMALLPVILRDNDPGEVSTFFGAVFMTNVVAYIFASRTYHQRDLLAKIATVDHLTGVNNRRALSQKLKESIEIKKRSQEPIAAILLDLDHFKKANDIHGHSIGDNLLVRICHVISGNIRLTDRLYRYGGEEFIVILRGSALADALMIAEKLRIAVLQDQPLESYGVTISLGVAELEEGETAEAWLKRVDNALYESKKSGRNKTTVANNSKMLSAS